MRSDSDKRQTMNVFCTNGQSGIEALQRAGVSDDLFSWDDVLHDGPVRDIPMEDFVQERAVYLAAHSDYSKEQVIARFTTRNSIMENRDANTPLVLVFEHDLYDQLQLCQILDYSLRLSQINNVFLLQTTDFIGEMLASDLKDLIGSQILLEPKHFAAARKMWSAICSPNPNLLSTLQESDFQDLPFFWSALSRFSKLYPSIKSGLTRTEEIVLDILSEKKELSLGKLFAAYQSIDAPKFMGDSSFANRINHMLEVPNSPISKTESAEPKSDVPRHWKDLVSISDFGRQVLDGSSRYTPRRDYWIGGVSLNSKNRFFFNPESEQIIERELSNT